MAAAGDPERSLHRGGGVGRPRRRRRGPDDVRRQVLEAMCTEVVDAGLTVSLEHISLDQVAEVADAPRSSVYRLWSNKQSFLEDLLLALVEAGAPSTIHVEREMMDRAEEMVRRHRSMLTEDVGRRRSLLCEVVREIALDSVREVTESASWKTFMAVNATLLSITEKRLEERLRKALLVQRFSIVRQSVRFYIMIGRVTGWRMSGGFDYDHLASMGAALNQGLALQQTIDPTLASETINFRPSDDQEQGWSVASVGFWSFLSVTLEPDPCFTAPPVDDVGFTEWWSQRGVEAQEAFSGWERRRGPLWAVSDTEREPRVVI